MIERTMSSSSAREEDRVPVDIRRFRRPGRSNPSHRRGWEKPASVGPVFDIYPHVHGAERPPVVRNRHVEEGQVAFAPHVEEGQVAAFSFRRRVRGRASRVPRRVAFSFRKIVASQHPCQHLI